MRYVRVPAERVGVVIGPEGSTRLHIEDRTGTRLQVDAQENEVLIDDANPKDPLGPLKAEEVVRAIARGFSPPHAFKLFSDDYYLHIFDMYDYVGKDKDHVRRLTSRIIGTEGKTRRIIEDLTGTLLSIYGHTVSLIGGAEDLDVAKTAVDMVLSGSEHAAVYKYLEGQRRRQKMARRSF